MLDVPFEEAIAYAESREVMLPGVFYDELEDAARRAAFTVSHVATLRQIGTVFDMLNKVLREGGTFGDFTRLVEAEGVDLEMNHRETVFRNAIQAAYNAGREQQHIDNEDELPYLMYDAINDSRTRSSHRAMDGYIAPVSHPIWKRWYPPNGHNCRCSAIALDERQAKARGYTGRVREPGADPDDGFAVDPLAGRQHALAAATREALEPLPPKVQRAAGRHAIDTQR